MSFDPERTKQQITQSMGAMVLLHASNQALIEVSIARSDSPWYQTINAELGAAEDLVVGWRQNGYLYFQQSILQQTVGTGQAFTGQQASIDALFEALESDFSAAKKQQVVSALQALEAPVSGMIEQMGSYLAKLKAYEVEMEGPYGRMNKTASEVQAQAEQIQAEINSINAQIAALQKQVIADRRAIAKAKRARTGGIFETIFGLLLAPVTGGLSLILAGIGVASIAAAEEKVNQLESTVARYQQSIVQDQASLSSDEKQVATLHGLTMSVGIALSDIGEINTALDSLRTTWTTLQGSLENAVKDVRNAETAQDALASKVWFDAACESWRDIVSFAQQLAANNAPVPKRVSIGS